MPTFKLMSTFDPNYIIICNHGRGPLTSSHICKVGHCGLQESMGCSNNCCVETVGSFRYSNVPGSSPMLSSASLCKTSTHDGDQCRELAGHYEKKDGLTMTDTPTQICPPTHGHTTWCTQVLRYGRSSRRQLGITLHCIC